MMPASLQMNLDPRRAKLTYNVVVSELIRKTGAMIKRRAELNRGCFGSI